MSTKNKGKITLGIFLRLGLALGFVFVCFSQSKEVRASGECSDIVGYWQAENDAKDSADAHDGTLMNGATFTTGKVGQAFSFDGSDDYVSVSNASESIVGYNKSRSVELWFNLNLLDSGTQRGIIEASNVPTEDRPLFLLAKKGNNVLSIYHGGNYRDGTTVLSANQWYHAVYTFDAATNQVNLYLNGNLEFSGVVDDAIIYHHPYIMIGTGFPNYFNGVIDEVAIYNRALTTDEVLQHYTSSSHYCASSEEGAIPEFTIITAIVAAVAGFGIYLLIRNKKQSKTNN